MRKEIERKNWLHKSLSEAAVEERLKKGQAELLSTLQLRACERGAVNAYTAVMKVLETRARPEAKLARIRELCEEYVVVTEYSEVD